MNPQDANVAFIRDNVELVPIGQAEGRIAAEGALPYPPGVLCVVPGEVWAARCSATSWRWKRASTACRAFRRSCRGLHREKDHGWKRIFGYMIKLKGRFAPALLIYPRGTRYFLR